MQPNNFTPFVFNDVSMTQLLTRVSEHQNSVRHEPIYKRKNVKLQINLLSVKKQLQPIYMEILEQTLQQRIDSNFFMITNRSNI